MAGARRDPTQVRFSVGERVVHPHHGAGEIVAKRRRPILGQVREYLTIRIAHFGMDVMVPSENACRIGLRHVISEQEAARAVAVLAQPATLDPGLWQARVKRYRERVSSGDVFELAAVLRDLAARHAADHLTSPERDLQERLRRILCSELVSALGVEMEGADARVGGALAAHSLRTSERADGSGPLALKPAA